jgi:hypothetical protein
MFPHCTIKGRKGKEKRRVGNLLPFIYGTVRTLKMAPFLRFGVFLLVGHGVKLVEKFVEDL